MLWLHFFQNDAQDSYLRGDSNTQFTPQTSADSLPYGFQLESGTGLPLTELKHHRLALLYPPCYIYPLGSFLI